MEWLHNSWLKRLASTIFELNIEDKPIERVSDFIQPVVEIKPIANIFAGVQVAGTVYTTPSDKDFYLCGYMVQGFVEGMTSGSTTALNFTTQDGVSQQIRCYVIGNLSDDGEQNAINGDFKYPLLLARGSTITLTTDGSGSSAYIYGYTGSDRSGN